MKLFTMCVVAAFASLGAGAQNQILDYAGRVSVGGKPFDGSGRFTFALVDDKGTQLWTTGETPRIGSRTAVTGALTLPIQQGSYSVRLGDPAGTTPPITASVIQNTTARLQIWFDDGAHGWQRAGNDVPLTNAATPITVGQGEAILKELRELRAMLQRQGAPVEPARTVRVGTAGSPSLGQANAPLVLVEFTDFQCDFCKKFHETVFPELVKQFVDTGKLRIVSRSLPLPFHPEAETAAVAALCANAQGKFWPMRERLLSVAQINSNSIAQAAAEIKLDLEKFRACWQQNSFNVQVKADMQEAAARGITGTPTFVLGRPSGDAVNGQVIVGAQPLGAFVAEINHQLAHLEREKERTGKP